jgi:branched-chain amino acid transport system substrate-binding protein
MRARTMALALILAISVGAAGCTSQPSNTGPLQRDVIHFYGTDGNMSNSLGDGLAPGLLDGMQGTTPLTDLSDEFKARLRTVKPNLVDFNYAGETYDAVVIAALAAQAAHSAQGRIIAQYVNGVTAHGQICNTPKACLTLLQQGADISYRGISMTRSGFTDAGEPSTATYGTLAFGRDNKIDDAKTQYVGAGSGANETTAPGPTSPTPAKQEGHVGPLKIGVLLPKSGQLDQMGAPMFAGAELAVRDINDAGGVLDASIDYREDDDGTDPTVAGKALDRMIAAGVQAVIGPSSSSATLALLPKIAAHGVLLISPSATSDELTKADDGGLFFRTSPPDVLQAQAVTNIIMRDGAQRVYILARDDSYGTGLENNVLQDLVAAGIAAKDIKIQKYEPDAAGFSVQANEAKTFGPDAILIVGFEESTKVIQAFATAGLANGAGAASYTP